MTVLEITSYGGNTLRRLRREARLIDPDAILVLTPAYELDRTAAVPTLTTEELPGVTLDDLLSLSPLPAAAALHALHDVAATLEALHDAGLAHGDVRASSVLVLPDGRAAITRPEPRPATEDGVPHPATDARDFALLAFELLTGVHALGPDAATAMMRSLPTLPPAAAAVLELVLTAEPGRRPLPHAVMVALDAIPPEDWPTNGLNRVALPPPSQPVVADVAVEPSGDDAVSATPDEDAAPAVDQEIEPLPQHPQQTDPDEVRIDPPPVRRTLLRRIFGPFVIVVGLLTVCAGGAAGAWLLFAPSPSAGDAADARPQVERVSLSVTPPQAMCPRATLHVAATVLATGGAGELDLRWQLPDGSAAQRQSLRFEGGRRILLAAIDLTLTGREHLRGRVVAVVGGVQASVTIRYLCPRRILDHQEDLARSI